MNQILAIRVFVSVAELGSFRGAARQLNVSNALITRLIAALEDHLHTRLLDRNTRNVALTKVGSHYLASCRYLLGELDRLDRSVVDASAEPGGTLRLIASSTLALTSLTPLLDGFRRLHPRVNIILTLIEDPVERFEVGYDVGLISGLANPGNEMVAQSLATHSMVLCAAPGYLADHEAPVNLEQLAQHALIGLSREQHGSRWHFTGPAGSEVVRLQPVYVVNSAMMVRFAALAGMGIAMLPSVMAAGDLEDGTLKRVLPAYSIEGDEFKVSLVYPNRQYLPTKTRSFIDYAVEHLSNWRGRRDSNPRPSA
ncbi:MAG: LysR family transcriptional regulator [Paraburkholderia sp.]|nr:LysR family transcriptional regulator [Burkholderia sp. 4M9327F10]